MIQDKIPAVFGPVPAKVGLAEKNAKNRGFCTAIKLKRSLF
jgi:hypothetical protein